MLFRSGATEAVNARQGKKSVDEGLKKVNERIQQATTEYAQAVKKQSETGADISETRLKAEAKLAAAQMELRRLAGSEAVQINQKGMLEFNKRQRQAAEERRLAKAAREGATSNAAGVNPLAAARALGIN